MSSISFKETVRFVENLDTIKRIAGRGTVEVEVGIKVLTITIILTHIIIIIIIIIFT